MLTYMKNFIISGNPNGDGLTEWKQNTGSDLLMSFDNETKMTDEPKHELFDILDKMDGWK